MASRSQLWRCAEANSIFTGDKLLTTDNNKLSEEQKMFNILGLTPRAAFKDAKEEHLPEAAEVAE